MADRIKKIFLKRVLEMYKCIIQNAQTAWVVLCLLLFAAWTLTVYFVRSE